MNTADLVARIEAEIAEIQAADAATSDDRQAVELDQQSPYLHKWIYSLMDVVSHLCT